MIKRTLSHTLCSITFRRPLNVCLISVWVLLLLASPLAAQTPQEAQYAEAEKLYAEAGVLCKQGTKESLEEAIRKYQAALPLYHALGKTSDESVTLSNIGEVYDLLGEKRKALDFYSQALPLIRAVGDRKGETITLNRIGRTYLNLGERQKALDYFGRVLQLVRALGDRASEAGALINIGEVYDSLEEKQKALDHYTQALPLVRGVGDQGGVALVLNNIAEVYDNLGRKQKALDFYAQVLPIFHAVGDRESEGVTLKNIGALYSALGEKQKALDYYFQALPLIRAAGNRTVEGATLNNIGRAYDDLGERQKALDYFGQAILIARAVGDRSGEATTLNNVGIVYDNLGEKQKAVAYYQQALPLFRANSDRSGEAMTLGNIGASYYALGEKQKALDYYSQALPIARAGSDRNGEASIINNIGMTYNDLGEKQKALDYFNQSMPLYHATAYRKGEATTLNNIGLVYNDLGEKQKALDYFEKALPLYRAIGDRSGEALTLYNLSLLERARSNFTGSLTYIAAAITIVESLRTKIGNQELRSSYFATVQNYYEVYIDLLMLLHKQKSMEGYDGQALQVSERARARSLLETLAESNADIRQGVDPQLLARERALQQQLNAKAQEQLQILSGNHTDEQASAIAKELDALTGEYQQTEVQIRQSSPHYAALTQPQPLSLKEIQTRVLDKDTLLLQYSLGTVRSYLWAVTQDSITSYELFNRKDIEDTAREVYTLLSNAGKWPDASTGKGSGQSQGKPVSAASTTPQSPEIMARLSQMILAPVASQLGKKRLVIVADGALQFIPFAALPIPNDTHQTAESGQQTTNDYRPLVSEHEIISLPSASTLAVLRNEVKDRQPAPKTLAVLADPVFERTDPRVKSGNGHEDTTVGASPSANDQRGVGVLLLKSAQDSGVTMAEMEIPRLPGTRQEAEQILALVPAASNKQAFDFMADRATATSEELSRYRYLHFATHGFLDSQHPELSGILFSMFDEHGQAQDGFLRAHQVFNLKLPAELVVLSACQTGLGKEIKGEGLVSLTRGFMYAGASRVVVSLWSVSDMETAELMTRFYRGMLKEGKRPAAALQAAQVSMLKEKRFAAPFFWAAFTLQGEWR